MTARFGAGSDPERVMRQMDANGFPAERPVFHDERDDGYPPGFTPDLSHVKRGPELLKEARGRRKTA